MIAKAIPMCNPDSARTCMAPAEENAPLSSFVMRLLSPMVRAQRVAWESLWGIMDLRYSAIWCCCEVAQVDRHCIACGAGSNSPCLASVQPVIPAMNIAQCDTERNNMGFFFV